MKILKQGLLLLFILAFSQSIFAQNSQQDTLVVQAFTFDDPSPVGWGATYKGKVNFPEGNTSWRKIFMVKTLKCDANTAADKLECGEWDYITQTVVSVPKGDTIEEFQLGTFVTPYGIRLNLGGEKGWQWIYDITDYSPILKGELDIVSGNNQELLDLKFIFIKGTPDREVLSVENIYPHGTYNYGKLADDSLLTEKKIYLSEKAEGFRLKARISGHGHFGPRNCCEWDSKSHSYMINEERLFTWNVWKDCGYNPIYPQGGTWQFDRAGWCPGTKVDEYNFELTPKVHPGDSIKLDYQIEAYADNGEKGGEFRMSHQLISYGPINFDYDAELTDIVAPSTEDRFSRENPICRNPRVIIKNTGKYKLKTLQITYGLKDGKKSVHTWHGNLRFLESEEVWLPAPDWKKLDKNQDFVVEISKPNNKTDQRDANNRLMSKVKLQSNSHLIMFI